MDRLCQFVSPLKKSFLVMYEKWSLGPVMDKLVTRTEFHENLIPLSEQSDMEVKFD